MLQRLSESANATSVLMSAVGTPMRLSIPPGSTFISTWRGVGSFWPDDVAPLN